MPERKMLDAQKIQSHLNAIKAMANVMLNEVEKVEQILKVKPNQKEMDFEARKALALLDYEKRFQRRLQKGSNKK